MKMITAEQFLEQAEAGALVLPQDNAETVGVQVGRLTYLARLRQFSRAQAAAFEALYREGSLRIGHPGDFIGVPCCFHNKRLRYRIVDAAALTHVPLALQARAVGRQ